MQVEIDSVLRGAYSEKRGPRLEVTAENEGTVVLKIIDAGGRESDFVEVSVAVLLSTLSAIVLHDAHSYAMHDEAYERFKMEATYDRLNHKETEKVRDVD